MRRHPVRCYARRPALSACARPLRQDAAVLPTVTIVFLVFNRREELRVSLGEMLDGADYDASRLEVIVVDNASQDGSADMVAAAFPQVRLIRRTENRGVSGWNDGFAVARGDYVLALDDDCFLPGDGLRRAVAAAQEHRADLVSFGVVAGDDPEFRFTELYRTGLLTFWGCAVLVRRPVLDALEGYDPEIFVWANELEFMLRFFEAGFRHLHAPNILAVHMKPTRSGTLTTAHWIASGGYRRNAQHYAYIAAKSLRGRDAIEALLALAAVAVRDAIRSDRAALGAVPACARGTRDGLRRRAPVRREISRAYRRNLESYASPWWFSRPPADFARAGLDRVIGAVRRRPRRSPPPRGRWSDYYAARTRYHPATAATLEFDSAPSGAAR